MDLFTLPSTEEEAVKFLQERGVFATQRKCAQNHDMRLVYGDGLGFHWTCTRTGCRNKRFSMRDGTWFQNSKLPLVKAVRFLYSWCLELTSLKWCKEHLDMNASTTTDWNRSIREVIAKDLDRPPCRKIGGEGRTVEVDETVIRDLKTNGRLPPPQWIVGGVCRETGQCFLKAVPDRTAGTFLDVVKDNVAEGSTVFCWKVCEPSDLEAAGFQHLAESQRLNFVDTTTGQHTRTIELMWEALKSRHNRQKGSARQCFDSYLDEFMWRREIGDTHPFEALLEAIKRSSNNEQCKGARSVSTLSNEEDQKSHQDEIQGGSYEVTQRQGSATENLPELCPACEMRFENVTDLVMHASEVHHFGGIVKQDEFQSYCAFERWKEEMEEGHSTQWVRRSWRTLNMVYSAQLRCYRPRRIKKRTPYRSAKPVQKSCTSFINVKRYLTSDITCVEYCLEHFGHEKVPPKPRLRWSVKLKIAEMLRQGLPVDMIVRVVQLENDGALKPQYSVTEKDVKIVGTLLKEDPEMFGMKASAPGKVRPNTELCKAEGAMPEASIKQEPDTIPSSDFKVESSPAESSVVIKEEPRSAMSLPAQPSTKIETEVPVEIKMRRHDLVPVYNLTEAPDGKGFALVNQTRFIVGRQDVS